MSSGIDPEIHAEREFLAHARASLRWRQRDVSVTPSVQDSSEDADYTVVNRLLRWDRERYAEALADLPDVPLFFGRMDYPAGTVFEDDGADRPTPTRTLDADRVYVGRRHVRGSDGDPLVIDWRAPISVSFYRATPESPHGARARRRYGFESGTLTAYEDEWLHTQAAGHDSELLATQIERPRSGPMRDIVATIQPEQDDLVRAPVRPALCVQGAPGTGKTAVGLHRIAYLLFNLRDQLRQDGGVVILGPNRAFLSYIRNVLPALGEVGVRQTTVEELIARAPVRREERVDAARVKGDARMAEVIRRALWGTVAPVEETVVVEWGSRRLRIPPEESARAVAELTALGTGYGSGPTRLTHRLANVVMRRLEERGESCDARTQTALRRDKALKAAVRRMWPKVDPVRLVYRLLTDPGALAAAADGVLTPEEQDTLLGAPLGRGPRSARWSVQDLALIDEAHCLIERPDTIGHIVIDEAQDLSPMQSRAVGRRCNRGSVTVLGDVAQGTSPWAINDWDELLAHLDQPDAHLAVLDKGFRVPAQIIALAARLLPHIAPGLGAPTGVRRAQGALTITGTEEHRRLDTLLDTCRSALEEDGAVGVIVPDDDIADVTVRLATADLPHAVVGRDEEAMERSRLVCVPATLAKGLEFDHVIVVEPARIVAAEHRGLHRLYVVLTRAVSALHIIHAEPLPEALVAEERPTGTGGG
ncbi:AAA family ATPase [Spiractinospora alimapuensis]|uniref:HelD family protein n=1 Tax=Spiractinospora alimapuensis TaxID=2820884 RepID=UPI001F16FB2A|nr:AAA family ATPase [Spiractinospora alimapuensis]QVQ52442.1 AAA family ATPase [Spiractinospora alimapuensis]